MAEGLTMDAITIGGSWRVPSYVTQVIKVVAEIHAREEQGAILTFLTFQVEIEWAREQF